MCALVAELALEIHYSIAQECKRENNFLPSLISLMLFHAIYFMLCLEVWVIEMTHLSHA